MMDTATLKAASDMAMVWGGASRVQRGLEEGTSVRNCCGDSGDFTGTEEVWSCLDGVGGRGRTRWH